MNPFLLIFLHQIKILYEIIFIISIKNILKIK
jgi:hypothetical protein